MKKSFFCLILLIYYIENKHWDPLDQIYNLDNNKVIRLNKIKL